MLCCVSRYVDPDTGPLDPADEGTMILCNAGNCEYTYTQRHNVMSQKNKTCNMYEGSSKSFHTFIFLREMVRAGGVVIGRV